MARIEVMPDSIWRLFRSGNRSFYMEALLGLYEEYEYNNYFISWEVCVQIFDNFFSNRQAMMEEEELESEMEKIQPLATRVLNWLIKAGWLIKQEDYVLGITNVVIPDYASVFLDAFERLYRDEEEEAEVYIRNVYASIFSFMNDAREDISLLKGALQNTKILNKSLQNMLHNMNRFFSSLLKQEAYGGLLEEHLNGYVEEVVKKKYRILKTSDNFYLYKNDIKNWLQKIMEHSFQNIQKLECSEEEKKSSESQKYILEYQLAEDISRGFDDIERRIYYMDKEHSKYVKATVMRIHYLLHEDQNTKGYLIRFLNYLSTAGEERKGEALKAAAQVMNLNGVELMGEQRFYKKRKSKMVFSAQVEPERVQEELSRQDIIRMNRTHNKYNRRQIEAFVEERMSGGRFEVTQEHVKSDEEFEKLILAYDYALRHDSQYHVKIQEGEYIENERYRYPKIMFQQNKQTFPHLDT